MLAFLIWPVAILTVAGATAFVADKVGRKKKVLDAPSENENMEADPLEATEEELKSKLEEMRESNAAKEAENKAMVKKLLHMKIQNRAATRSGLKFEKEEQRRWKAALRL